MEKVNFTLPDGRLARGTASQARAVWRHWRGLCAVAVSRGEGIRVSILAGDVIELTTVYAPQYEAHRVLIRPSGRVGYASEQSAPDYKPDPRPVPWEEGRGS